MGELVVVENKEVLLGARYLPQEEGAVDDNNVPDNPEYHWHLVGDLTSDMLEYTLSDQWYTRVNSEHYKDLWGDLLRDLNGREGPVEIVLDNVYEFGMLTQEGVSEYLDKNTGKGPQFLVVFASTDDEMPMSCVWMRGWDISSIEITDERTKLLVREEEE
jgi:hypothetical protein